MTTGYDFAWDMACQHETDLASGVEPQRVATLNGIHVNVNTADLRSIADAHWRLQRFYGESVTVHTGPTVAFGHPAFVAGVLLGSAINRQRVINHARQFAAPRWHDVEDPVKEVAVVNQMLWIRLGDRWSSFALATITQFGLRDRSMMLHFDRDAPLCLTGAWAPWVAVDVAYATFGRDVARKHPELAAVRHNIRSSATPQVRGFAHSR